MQTKTIGRMPTDHGPYVPGQAYGKKFQVQLYGCVWESKHDNNNTAPATLNTQAGTITPNTTDWKKVTGSTDQWLIDNGYKPVSANNVKDGNQSQHDINSAFATEIDSIETEIGNDSTPVSVKGRIKTLETEVGNGGSVDERIAEEGARHYLKSETYTKQEVNGLVSTPHQEYVTVADFASLPVSGSEDTIYRVSNYDGTQVAAGVYSEYAWNGTQYVFLCAKSSVAEVFDISEYHSGQAYATLEDALDPNSGGGVPQSLQNGGMSIKFVRTSDSKYVQYRLIADSWSINTDEWAIAEEGVHVENPEFVYVKTDAEDKILLAIKINGDIYFGAGVPQQVKEYIEEKISSLSLDEYEDIVAFLSDYLDSDTTLKVMIDGINAQIATKLDAEGLDPEALGTVQAVENSEYIQVTTDSEGKILEGITLGGVKKVMVPTEFKSMKNLDTDIISWYPTETMGVMLENLRLGVMDNNGQYYYNGQTYNYPPVTPLNLLWFSDIHENAENLQRISKFFNTYKDKLDDVIFTGDVTLNTFQTFNDNYWSDNGGNDFLFCIGNHDAAISLSPYQPASPKQTYEKYLLPYINNTNVICQTNKNYWYKDYSEAKSPECPGGIRLISIDQYHWKEGEVFGTESYEDGSPVDTGQQEQWLIDTLEDARINGLAVIIAMHGSAVLLTNVQCSFNNPSKAWSHNYTETRLDMLNAVQTFIDAGGEFICWISGHWHQDWIGNIQHLDANGENVISYPQQTQIVISTASYSMPWRDIHMIKDTKSMDCFNIFHVDTLRKWILLFRVGVDVDKYGRHIGSLVYDYRNKNIIFNN